jgi:hypothetical protein
MSIAPAAKACRPARAREQAGDTDGNASTGGSWNEPGPARQSIQESLRLESAKSPQSLQVPDLAIVDPVERIKIFTNFLAQPT